LVIEKGAIKFRRVVIFQVCGPVAQDRKTGSVALAKAEIGKAADVVEYLRRNFSLHSLFFCPF
jgi:hypothetical protein